MKAVVDLIPISFNCDAGGMPRQLAICSNHGDGKLGVEKNWTK